MNCKNCASEVNQNFCPNCGYPAKLKRIDGHYIAHEIEHVLHFERGILFTVKELFINPGQNIRSYISENRSRLVKPVIFIIITSLIYTLISHFFHIEDEYVKYEGLEKSAFVKILGWFKANYGYMNILTGMFIAIWLKLFFKKYNYNFFELLIMLCFVLGISMLIFAFFAIFEGILHIKLLNIAGMFSLVYLIWATGNFFKKNKIINYFKALVCYLLGMITFFILTFAIGITIDIITKP
ncbi:DUF3667 domain-containing protein [Flavobacterium pectinovorum]|uniref:DUF3667 domain-containing protein n=1 Tax=Flavobacterium pectinovorum TaxID=29533 RepID=UPI001FADC75F|nr:DUF3667 domain-containing protein [Flavobacterium pectinovorum]MCI9846916.1 DUF3667 domain-containing protein [Flavobacterium pectinovorum]